MTQISAGDQNNHGIDEALRGIDNMEKTVQDIIIYSKDLPTHSERETESRSILRSYCPDLSRLVWFPYQIEYTPSPNLVKASLDFPIPSSKKNASSFLGLVQQFEIFSHCVTELAIPISSLISTNSVFLWQAKHQQLLEVIIKELASPGSSLTFIHPVHLDWRPMPLNQKLWEQFDNKSPIQPGSWPIHRATEYRELSRNFEFFFLEKS